MARILVVEDEKDLCNVIRAQLEAEGHAVVQALDGPSALALVEQHCPELVILDLMLPGMDGMAVCRRIRARHLMPILMLTARSREADRVLGLEAGADDYVVKPFSMLELLARVRALLRRIEMDSRSLSADDDMEAREPVVHGALRVDLAARVATLVGVSLDLTPKEFDLLWLFAAHPGRAFSRRFLLARLWSDEFEGLDRTVDTHVTRLRKKLGTFGERIVTVWGTGYRFEP